MAVVEMTSAVLLDLYQATGGNGPHPDVMQLWVENAALRRQLAVVREELERQRHAAYHDELTRLPNRRALLQRAAALLAATDHAAAMVIDLDQFKPINDTHGHDMGDRVLKEIGRRMAGWLHGRWLYSRLGGDEFAAVRPGPIDSRLLLTDARWLSALIADPVEVDGHPLQVRASIGLAEVSGLPAAGPAAVSLLLGRADTAMYRSKREGEPVLWDPWRDDDSLPVPGRRPAVRTRELRRESTAPRQRREANWPPVASQSRRSGVAWAAGAAGAR